MREFLGPAKVRNVYHSVDAWLDFDKRAEISQAANSSGDDSAGWVFLCGDSPGVGFGLLKAQTDLLFFFVDVEYDPFNVVFEADKYAIVHHVDNSAFDFGADRISRLYVLPWAFCLLFKAKRYFFALFIYTDDDAFDLLIEFHDFGWM